MQTFWTWSGSPHDARALHAKQVRTGTSVPYIGHRPAVTALTIPMRPQGVVRNYVQRRRKNALNSHRPSTSFPQGSGDNAMQIDVTLKNYRCFSDEKPARFAIRNGFTAFVGANNSGKSTLVRFLYELRNLFTNLIGQLPTLLARPGNRAGFTQPESVRDLNELFYNGNDRDLEIKLEFTWDDQVVRPVRYPQ